MSKTMVVILIEAEHEKFENCTGTRMRGPPRAATMFYRFAVVPGNCRVFCYQQELRLEA